MGYENVSRGSNPSSAGEDRVHGLLVARRSRKINKDKQSLERILTFIDLKASRMRRRSHPLLRWIFASRCVLGS
jgi:hypothetical protein